MGKPRPIDEIASEAKEVASGLGISATGKYEKRGDTWYFEITNGTEYKWRTLGDLKKIKNHFNRSTLEQQIIEVAKIAQNMGLSYTGKHNHLSGNARKFELSNNQETRWSALCNLRAGKNPFTVATLDQQLIEAREHAKKLNLTLTGKNKLIKRSRKYEVSNGVETKWISKEHLKEGKSPFTLRSLTDQINQATSLANAMGLTFTGKINEGKSNKRRFELTDGIKFRWSTLNRLEEQINPFSVATIEEQCQSAAQFAKEISLTFTGNNEKRQGHQYFEVTDGKDFRWTTLGGLRKHSNPFKDGGFDGSKTGIFYILKIKLNEQLYVGYGITNQAKGRFDTHKYELKKAGGVILEKMTYQFQTGKNASNLETLIKRTIPKVNLGVRGFMTECTTADFLEKIISLAEEAYEAQVS
jgi:predicted GIY-YIG superfamily endonuclease